MSNLRSFSPEHLAEEAEHSGFFQCPQCGLIWFGRTDIENCPEGPHGKPVHIALLCRVCDIVVPVEKLAEHLAGLVHASSVKNSK
jgi:hypothetical protein